MGRRSVRVAAVLGLVVMLGLGCGADEAEVDQGAVEQPATAVVAEPTVDVEPTPAPTPTSSREAPTVEATAVPPSGDDSDVDATAPAEADWSDDGESLCQDVTERLWGWASYGVEAIAALNSYDTVVLSCDPESSPACVQWCSVVFSGLERRDADGRRSGDVR